MPGRSEPPIREFSDRSTLWLLELPENLRELVRLVARDIADRLDFTRAERINRSFIPGSLHKQEADLLTRVPYRDGEGEVWVYLLLEHQSQPDVTMGLRLLSYMVQVWDAQRRSWKRRKRIDTPPSLHPNPAGRVLYRAGGVDDAARSDGADAGSGAAGAVRAAL
jgi:hypothetical protein